jgi:hypothetical protein
MSERRAKALFIACSIVAGLCTGPGAAAAASADVDRWQFHVLPYVWLPTVESSARVALSGLGRDVTSLKAETGPNDYLSDLQMAAMVMGEARKGPWSVYTDLLYTSFGNQETKIRDVSGPAGLLNTQIGRDAKRDLSTTVWTLAGGYRAIERDNVEIDLMAGARYLTMASDLDLTVQGATGRLDRRRKVSLDQDLWDGIVGFRGRILFPGSNWYIPFYADIGTGESKMTWQAMLGAGYRFDWGEVTLAYRALGYDFDKNDADLTLYGPGLGVGFHW